MSIFKELLSPERVGVADLPDKEEALTAVIDLLTTSPAITDRATLVDALRAREDAMPTGVGHGLGVPHVRHNATEESVGALLVLRRGIDYGSMDDEPVRALFAVAMPESSRHQWLLCLAELSGKFRNRDFREQLFACADAAAVWNWVNS